jgi:dihydroorotate dehydrogenase electron transfer subunit
VEATREVAPDIYEMLLRAPEVAAAAQPGQFIHLRVGDGLDPLLRRPLSIGFVQGDRIGLMWRVVGHGTELLTQVSFGDRLDVIGPLGHPFTLHTERPAVMVAGGMGIAVMPLLAEQLMAGGCPRVTLLYGARTAGDLIWSDRVRALGVEVVHATDDGTTGHHGVCTDLMAEVVGAMASVPAIYVCGPDAMLRKVLKTVTSGDVPLQLAFEQRMGCGIGACMACAIETRDGYVRACMEGPVLNGELFR